MTAEHRQEKVRYRASPIRQPVGDHNVVSSAVASELDIDGTDIGLRAEPVSEDPPVGQLRDHLLHHGMVDA